MNNKSRSKARHSKSGPVSATATAKVEATARASYTVSKKVQQTIPEDVTRARSNAWLELISPITEWAGLKGDAIRAKRASLRIQQEAALHELARFIRLKVSNKKVIHPIPVKILIPALEHASLENPDSNLLEWWADLLVSGATTKPLRPFLVELLNKIGPNEALVIDKLWTDYLSKNWKSHYIDARAIKTAVSSAVGNMIMYHLHYTEHLSDKNKKGELLVFLQREILKFGWEIGVPITYEIIGEWNNVETGMNKQFSWLQGKHVELEVCQALGVAQRSKISNVYMGSLAGMAIYVWHLTELGFELMQACKPAEQMQLEDYEVFSSYYYIETEFKNKYKSSVYGALGSEEGVTNQKDD